MSAEEREEELYKHETALDEAAQDLVEGRHRKLQNVAAFILETAGINLPNDSHELKGNHQSEYEGRLSPAVAVAGKKTGSTDAATSREAEGVSLSKLVRDSIIRPL